MRTSNLSILAQHATQTGSILSETNPAYRSQRERASELFDQKDTSSGKNTSNTVRIFAVIALLVFFAVISQSL